MGPWVSKIKSLFNRFKREQRIVMVGLDAAGKTTILYKLHLGDVIASIPTIGFNVETIEYKNLKLTMWDVGGQHRIRPLWRHYFQNTDAMIFVVDSSDRERIEEAKEELFKCLDDEMLKNVPVLVFSNKADMPKAMPAKEVVAALGLDKLRNLPWHVQESVAVKGDGLYEGLDWLAKTLNEAQAKK